MRVGVPPLIGMDSMLPAQPLEAAKHTIPPDETETSPPSTPEGTRVCSSAPVVGFNVTSAPAPVTATIVGWAAAAGLAGGAADALGGLDGAALETGVPAWEHAESTAAAVRAATPSPMRPSRTTSDLFTMGSPMRACTKGWNARPSCHKGMDPHAWRALLAVSSGRRPGHFAALS